MTESSESVLAGTKRPPFRLYCNAVVPPGANIRVRPAVSEEFVVSCLKHHLQTHLLYLFFPQMEHIHSPALASTDTLAHAAVDRSKCQSEVRGGFV